MKLKKILVFAVTCAAFAFIFAVGTGAQKLATEDYEYELLKDGTVEITKYISDSDTANIPSEIDGRKVTSIGDTAFENNITVVSVTIPDSVTSIKAGFESLVIAPYGAFHGCTVLKNVTIPESLTSIGAFAFMGCTALEEVDLPSSLTRIGKDAFYGTALMDMQDDDVKYAQDWVIGADKDIKKCTLSSGTKGICDYAFKQCADLESVAFSDSMLYIGDGAFDGCISLLEVSIPSGVASINRMSFMDCTALTNVSIPTTVKSINVSAFTHCTSLKNIIIPEGVEFVSDNVFNGCTALTSVSIPKSLNRVIFDAFSCCPSLAAIYCAQEEGKLEFDPRVFPECAEAYYECTPLLTDSFSCYEKNGEIAVAVYIGESAEVIIPRQINEKLVTKIESSVFNNRTNIKSVLIPDSVTEIASSAFDKCVALETVYYGGTQEQWDTLKIGEENSLLHSANIVCDYSVGSKVFTDGNKFSLIIIIGILVVAGVGFAGIFAIIDRKKNKR